MTKHFYISLFIVLNSGVLFAQKVINTDNPDQSDGTHIVEKKYFQVETSFQFSKNDATHGFDNITLIRYGITRRFEVRLSNQYTYANDSGTISGTRPLTLSFKNQLTTQHGLLPKLTLVSYFRLPFTISPGFPVHYFGYTFTLAARHDLANNLKIYSNFGVSRDEESGMLGYLGTLELNYNFTAKFSGYVEYFGNYAVHVYPLHGLDIGFIYALKNNFAIELALGSPTLKLGLNRFISTGVSLRLPG